MCLPLATCCFCISLDVGSKIISILNLVFSSLTVLMYGSAALLPHAAGPRRVVFAALAAAATLHVLVGIALVYGAFRKKPSFLLPWIATACVSGAALASLAVLGAALLVLGVQPEAEVSTMVSVYFLQGVLLYYLSSVVSSRRQEILREDSTESAERLMRRYHAAYKYAV